MAGATRNQTRDPSGKASTFRATTNENNSNTGTNDARATPLPSGASSSAHEDEFRLSEDLEPMSLSHDHQMHQNNNADASSGYEFVGEHIKDIIATITKLEVLGLQKLNIPLPRMVLLGDQSTGKSSVVEAISGITTPRSDETCTRCPLFIKMEPSNHPSASWVACVSLRQGFRHDGNEYQQPERLFPGWVQTSDTVEVPFMSTNSRAELTKIIDRAQMAVICPHLDHLSFAQPTVPHVPNNERCDFSPNIVCISISGPDLPNLSFYDLPGIIGQSEDPKKQFLVPFVKALVTDYITQPDALILLTCSLSSDIATSTASGIARNLGAEDRCIGVLTKPDCIARGSREEKLREVLNGNRFALGHGYFVVRNLSQEEINEGLTHREAREREREFFTRIPWSSLFQDYRSRFGTYNLQIFLSRKLAANVLTKLSVIREEIECRLEEIKDKLQTMPKTPSENAVRIIADLITSFTSDVRQELDHEFDHTDWWDIWDSLQTALADALRVMQPTLLCSGDLDVGIYSSLLPGRSADDSIVIPDDKDEAGDMGMPDAPDTPAKKRKREAETPSPATFKTLNKTPNTISSTTPSSTPTRRPTTTRQGTRAAVSQPADFESAKKQFSVDSVTEMINKKSKSKMPGQVHPKLREMMTRSATEKWYLPLDLFFNTLEKSLTAWIKACFDKHFGGRKGTRLYNDAWANVADVLQNNLHEQRAVMAADILSDQSEGPYIFYRASIKRDKAAQMEKYRLARKYARFKLYTTEMEEQYERKLSSNELEKLKTDAKVAGTVAEEPYASVIFDVMADITAYYIHASQRFHDAICMRIESKFFKRLREELKVELETTLGIFDGNTGPMAAQILLAQSPEREQRRRELVASQVALDQGLKILDDLQEKYGDGPPAHGFCGRKYGPLFITPPVDDVVDVTMNDLSTRLKGRMSS